MATKEVLFSVCDRCGSEAKTDVERVVGKPGRKAEKTLLPTGWLHVQSKSALVPNVFALDLCGKCSKELVNWTTPLVEAREGE